MFLSIPENIKRRICSQGVMRTLYYSFFVFILPRMGIVIKHVYGKKTSEMHLKYISDTDLKADAVDNYDNIPDDDLQALVEFEGNDLLDRIQAEIKGGNTCVFGRNSAGKLIGMAVLEDISDSRKNHKTYLLRDGFVFPKFRGKNYFPAMIDATYLHAINLHRNRETMVVGNVILGNYASSSGILKANFSHLGISVTVFGKQWMNFPFGNQ